MINYEPYIVKALLDDPDVFQMTDGRIYAGNFPLEESREYPHILVLEMDNVDKDYEDNKAVSAEIDIQINLWVKADDNIGPLQTAVDKKMKALNCRRITVSSFDEDDRSAFRRAFLYRTIVKLKEEDQ
ncbi:MULTISPECIES: hypothetical protein [unclassified Bacillus (in: firmicutes)]|uniref:hypothetical protein n=1 Tax=unclassified Bacillus (in: firmicutes) TaxID=185979 RepID=UPI0030EF29D3